MTTKTKTPTKAKKHTPEATERLRKAASKEIGERLAKEEEASASPTAAAPNAVPPKGKKEKQAKDDKPKQLGGLDAAAIVLKEAGTAMNTKQMWAAIDARKLWWSEGATPFATLYSAIIREIAAKGKDSRFRKAARGKFEFCGKSE